MKILLINDNPVVSRLTALSARKEDIEIDEVEDITKLNSDNYDIVFVDADSWSKEVEDTLSHKIKVQKKVLFYTQEDKNKNDSFDITILKPFLPSEVSAVIRGVEKNPVERKATVIEEETHFNILENKNSREELFQIGEDTPEPMDKENIIADKKVTLDFDLEKDLPTIESKVEEKKSSKLAESFDEKLEELFPLNNSELEDELFEKESSATLIEEEKSILSKNEDDLFELDLNDDKISLEQDLFSEEKTSKEKTLKSEDKVLDFDFEKTDEFDLKNDELDAVIEDISKVDTPKEESRDKKNHEDAHNKKEEVTEMVEETKVLDGSEIANIKNLLDDKDENNLELEELMTPATALMQIDKKSDEKSLERKKVKKRKNKKFKNGSALHSDVLLETLTSLPIESLRELLSGAKVNISIKFPKVK